jgi:hypothetical protein
MVGIARGALLGPALCLAIIGPPLCVGNARAQETTYIPAPSNYGGVGLLDMRTARFLPDGYLAFTASLTEPDDRYALTFQALPWAEFTFRYAIDRGFPNFDPVHPAPATLHDRSFDVKFRLWHEGEYAPEVALGLQDILGTGAYSAEYLVGSKRWGPFDLSLGLGWGRLATRGMFGNPLALFSDHFGTRPVGSGEGGVPLLSSYFTGPNVGMFGGLSYDTPIRGVTLKLEYSSDAYSLQSMYTGIDYSFPLNVGLSYRGFDWFDIGVSLMHGRDFGLRISTLIDPQVDIWPARIDPPPRFRAREANADTLLTREATIPQLAQTGVETRFVDLTKDVGQLATIRTSGPSQIQESVPASATAQLTVGSSATNGVYGLLPDIRTRIKAAVEEQVLVLGSLTLEAGTLKIAVLNGNYLRDAEAIARTARVLSAEAPPEVETFAITIMRAGVPLTTVTLSRSGIDRLAVRAESPAELFYSSDLKPASNDTLQYLDTNLFPRFGWNLYPIFRQSFFDPDHPIYIELGAGVSTYVELMQGWFVEGAFKADFYDQYDQITRVSNSVLPHVRSDGRYYLQQGRYGIESLATSYFFKPLPEFYGRVTAGYVEQMFSGIGGELLYRPFGKRWALGVDLWRVQQRDFDTLFDLRDYKAWTGHVTAYYALPWYDLLLAASYGKYLAGDQGTTFEISRRFATGITIGAWFTLTNVSSERFGEGSFDKGIRIVIPFEWAAPFRTQQGYELALRPIQRDGGQRLNGDAVLYNMTTPSDYGELSRHWNSVFGR